MMLEGIMSFLFGIHECLFTKTLERNKIKTMKLQFSVHKEK